MFTILVIAGGLLGASGLSMAMGWTDPKKTLAGMMLLSLVMLVAVTRLERR